MSWPDRQRYFCSLQSFQPLSFFSDWRRTVLSKFFDTLVPSIFIEELVLRRHALSCFRHSGLSLLLCSYLTKRDRIENSSCSAFKYPFQDTSHLILHRTATDSLSLYDLWSRPWGVVWPLWFYMLPFFERGRVTTT